jgi:hypothetical protein
MLSFHPALLGEPELTVFLDRNWIAPGCGRHLSVFFDIGPNP